MLPSADCKKVTVASVIKNRNKGYPAAKLLSVYAPDPGLFNYFAAALLDDSIKLACSTPDQVESARASCR